MTLPTRTFELLGTSLLATDYDELIALCQRLTNAAGTSVVDFTNTQIVTLRRQDAHFRALTRDVDYFVPDGMPLVWCLNAQRAELRDRVYGPTFMRRCLQATPAPWKHYLLGGSAEASDRLRARFPEVQFIGGFHGECADDGHLASAEESAVLAEIAALSPDFIWVGLGAPKQYEWIHRYRARIARGVFLAVGFAFDVNAGIKKDAPAWMQRAGLTWAFRMGSEPRRLFARYLRYNSLFLYYLAHDALRPPPSS